MGIDGLDRYIFVEYDQFFVFEVDNFSNGVGAFCAKYMRRPFQWITEPIHRDCRWWDQHLLEKALQRQMDAVQAVRQLCAQRFHSQIPCIFIRCPWGPASIETVEVPMKA